MNITLEQDKVDECCYGIFDDGKYVGLWCSKSHKVVVDGDLLGFVYSAEELIERFGIEQVPCYTLREIHACHL